MDDVHAKEINLIHTTVKIPGLRPRTTKTVPNYPAQHPNQDAKGESKTSFSLSGECSCMDLSNVRVLGASGSHRKLGSKRGCGHMVLSPW